MSNDITTYYNIGDENLSAIYLEFSLTGATNEAILLLKTRRKNQLC